MCLLLDPSEPLDIDNHLAQHMIQRLDQSPMHSIHHQTGDESNSNLVQHIKSEVIDAKQQAQQQQQAAAAAHHQAQQQQQQQQLHAQQLAAAQGQAHQQQQQAAHQQQQAAHQQQQQQHHQQQAHQQHHQEITGATVMEIDPSQIKHEPGMIITPEIVNMMTTGHMGE